MDNKQIRDEIEINIADVSRLLFSKALIIILVGVVFAVVSGVGTKLFVTPMYQSETSLYVLSEAEENNLTNSDLNKNTLLIKDYAELIKSRSVMEAVIKTSGMDMTPAELNKKVNVTIKNGTRVMSIEVKDQDPETAKQLANIIREEGSEHIKKVMESKAVKVVDKANLPTRPISPNLRKNMIIAGVLGSFLVIGFVVIKNMLDDTIKTADDVEHYLGLSVLGSVPLDQEDKKNRKKTTKSSKHSKEKSNHLKRNVKRSGE